VQLKENLSHIDYLQVTDSNSSEIFCGSDQEWFPTERQRLTGCGPSAAANILFYIDRKDNSGCCGRNRTDLLSFMEEAWQSVTPGKDGIPSTAIFLEKVEQYAKLHGKTFHYFVLNIPTQQSERPSLSTVTEFIRQGLRSFPKLKIPHQSHADFCSTDTAGGLDNKKRRYAPRGGVAYRLFLWGFPKGATPPFGTRLCEAKCSVLYALPALP
jgi:hypothetical protein